MSACRVFACLFAMCLIPSVSQAQAPWMWNAGFGGGYGGWANGWGGGFNTGGFGYVPPPPYYSVHPPVYYSQQIIRRPYGVSPFALPAQPSYFATSSASSGDYAAPAAPMVIVNPFIAGAADFVPASTAEAVRNSLPAVIPASPTKSPSEPQVLPSPAPAPAPSPAPALDEPNESRAQ